MNRASFLAIVPLSWSLFVAISNTRRTRETKVLDSTSKTHGNCNQQRRSACHVCVCVNSAVQSPTLCTRLCGMQVIPKFPPFKV